MNMGYFSATYFDLARSSAGYTYTESVNTKLSLVSKGV
jgi:hypothetical protein